MWRKIVTCPEDPDDHLQPAGAACKVFARPGLVAWALRVTADRKGKAIKLRRTSIHIPPLVGFCPNHVCNGTRV